VEVAVELQGDRVQLRVSDTGIGIAPELLPYVFEPFTQGPQSLDRSRGGLGLGLAMVKGFVELHGGEVTLSSNAGGTEIVVALPVVAAEPVEPSRPLPHVVPRRVLVIEDQQDAAMVLETALSMLGLEVRVAANGHAGIELAREFHPEIVLCDIGLPGMDGYDVARAFRSDDALRDSFLVALSGYAQPEDIERATTAGFSRHVAKPATLETLTRVIAEVP
jgi:two-component system CheB/CheR fusion protein